MRPAQSVYHVGRVSLRKRGKWWQVRYSTPAGRIEKQLEVTNLQVAEKEARRIDDLLQRGEYGLLEDSHRNQHTTFADLIKEFKAN